jgi:hypothetical protein
MLAGAREPRDGRLDPRVFVPARSQQDQKPAIQIQA